MTYIYIFISLYIFVCIYGIVRKHMDIKSGKLCPDWKGALEKSFRWSTFRFEWGRICYCTNCMGQTTNSWWEWENE